MPARHYHQDAMTVLPPPAPRRPRLLPLDNDIRECAAWVRSVLATSKLDQHLDTSEAVQVLAQVRRVLARVQRARRRATV